MQKKEVKIIIKKNSFTYFPINNIVIYNKHII